MASDLHTLTTDTQVTLLLCGVFSSRPEPKPLTTGQYNTLTGWLRAAQLRPGDLLTAAGQNTLASAADDEVLAAQARQLLERGGALGFALEEWAAQGLWVLGRSDPAYPARWRERLGPGAPPILYGVGSPELLTQGGLAIVGSRAASEGAIEFAQALAWHCTRWGLPVISGGARGVDEAGLQGSLQQGGSGIAILAGSLAREAVAPAYREALREDRALLVSPFYPGAGFTVGQAMARNKLVYALADAAVVVASDLEQGGTWAGALENLTRGWTPLLVRVAEDNPPGNLALIGRGAMSLPEHYLNDPDTLAALLRVVTPLAPPVNAAPADPQFTLFPVPAMEPAPERDLSADEIWEQQIWPFLAPHFRLGVDAKDLQVRLGIEPKQTQVWLKRALAEKRIRKQPKSKPVRYVLVASPPTQGRLPL